MNKNKWGKKRNSKWLKDLIIRRDTIKLLEEIIDKTFPDTYHTNVLLGQTPKVIGMKGIQKKKNKQMGLNQTYKILHSKGNHKQSEKTTYRMGQNI